MEVVLALILIAAAFFIGRRQGSKTPAKDSPALLKARETAWQEGYGAAVRFYAEQQRSAAATAAVSETAPGAPEPVAPEFSNAGPATPEPRATELPAADSVPQAGATTEPQAPSRQLFWQAAPATNAATVLSAASAPPVLSTPAKPVRVLSKRERELRNINITLYVAALMIVAAGALFLSFALPPVAKLVALFALAGVFYGGGLIVHATRASLRPAAAAFAGTGLALLPLSAIATYNTVNLSGPTVWLVFSAIATLAVGYATLRFRSRVLAWLAVLILVSTAMAGAATMQRGVFYYLLFLLLLSIILLLAATRSAAVRASLFFQALHSTAQLLPALVLGLAVILASQLSARDYLWVFFLLTVQQLLGVRLFDSRRHLRFLGARLSAMLTVVAGCAVLELRVSTIALVLAFLLAAQGVAVLVAGGRYREVFAVDDSLWRIERASLWVVSLLSVVTAYEAGASASESSLISLVVVPVLMLSTLPGLWRNAKIEAAALLLFAFVPAADSASDPWRLLPSLILALVIMVLISRRTEGAWNAGYRMVLWFLGLALGITAGRSTATLMYPSEFPAQSLGSILGLWVVLFAWWAADILRLNSNSLRIRELDLRPVRIAFSALAAAGTLAALTGLGSDQAQVLFGLSHAGWFVVGMIPAVVLTMASGLRIAAHSAREEHLVRATAAGILVLIGLLSLTLTWWQVAPLLGLALIAYFLFEARRVHHAMWKMIYAGAAQLIFSGSIWWFTWHMDFDVHGQFAMFMVSLVLPQLARLGYAWRQHQQPRSELKVIAWVMLGFLPVSTAVYLAVNTPADRGVLLLASVMFGLYGSFAFLADRQAGFARQFYLLAPILGLLALIQIPAWSMSTTTGWVRSAWWDTNVSFGMLLVFAVLAASAEWMLRRTQNLSLVLGVALFAPLLVLAAWNPASGWIIAGAVLAAIIFTLLVHTRAVAWFAAGTGIFTSYALYLVVQLWREQQIPNRMQTLDLVWVLLGASFILYVLAAAHGRFAEPTPRYPQLAYRAVDPKGAASRLYLAMGLATAAGAGGLAHLGSPGTGSVLGGAALIFAVAVALRIFECPQQLKPFTVDLLLPLAACLGMSSYIQLEHLPQASTLAAYGSVVFVLLALWRMVQKTPLLEHRYLVVAGVLANLAMLADLIQANPVTRIYALVFFAALIAYGLKQGRRLYIWWGAATITLAVLWSLRSLAFLWLVILGLGLIVAAVIKLSRVDKNSKQDSPQSEMPHSEPPNADSPR